MKVDQLIQRLLILFFLLLPTWGVIGAQVGFLTGQELLFSSSRYLIVALIFFLCTVALCLRGGTFQYNFGFFILLVYAIYIFSHVIGDTELLLVFEGFRHEVLFVLMAVLLFAYGLMVNNKGFLPEFNVIIGTVLINGAVAAAFAIWQFFDETVLELLYRKSLEEINNITLAIGYRLTSTMVNPINFGSYMVMCFVAVQYYFENKKISSVLYFSLFLLLFFLVMGSLSRLALLSMIVVLIYFYLYKTSLVRFFMMFLLMIAAGFYVLTSLDFELILGRFDNLLISDAYTGNDRVGNWGNAISSLEPYQYIWGRGMGASSPDSSIVAETSAITIENGFVSIFIQYGVLGLFLLFLVIGRFFYIGQRIMRFNKSLGKFCVGFLLFFLVISMGNDFFRNSPFVLYFWFFYIYFELLCQNYRVQYKSDFGAQ